MFLSFVTAQDGRCSYSMPGEVWDGSFGGFADDSENLLFKKRSGA